MRTIQDHKDTLNALRVDLAKSEKKPHTPRAVKPKGGALRRAS